MEKKINLQEFSESLSERNGLSRKQTEFFLQALFDMIEQGLEVDKFVKIRGLGTFKLITVSERESININTGERFQIGSHTKISFTPDNSLKELVNKPFSQFQTVVINEGTDLSLLEAVDSMPADEEYETGEGNTPAPTADQAPDTAPAATAAPSPAVSARAIASEVPDVPETKPAAIEETATPEEDTAAPGVAPAAHNAETLSTGQAETAPATLPDVPTPADASATPSPAAATADIPPLPEIPHPVPSPEEELRPTPPAATPPGPRPEPATERPLTPSAPAPENAARTHATPEAAAAEGTAPHESQRAKFTAPPTSCSEIHPEVQYIIQEKADSPRPNVWKFVAIVLVVAILMAFSYCAGYYHMLCPN